MKRYVKEYWPYLLALLPAMLLRDFSPATELRYVSIASELLEGDHFFCLQWQGEDYPYIMPLYVWLIALLGLIFRHHFMIVITLLLSFVPCMVVLAVMNRWVERYDTRSFRLIDGSQSRILASIMLFTCGLLFAMSFFVGPDMLFVAWIVLSLYTFWRLVCGVGSYGQPSADRRASKRLQWTFGLYVFLAILTKGPMGAILIMLVTTLYLLMSGRRRLWGRVWNWRAWTVILSLMGLWCYLTYREGGSAWVSRMFVDVPVGHFVNALEHDRPWWYYLVSIWAVSQPWGPVCIVVLVISLVRRVRRGESRWRKPFGSSLQNFYVLTLVTMVIYYSLRSSKLDVNLLPAYPFLVYAGVMQLGAWRWPVRWQWPIIWICRAMLLVVFVGGCLCPWLNTQIDYGRVCYRSRRISRELHTEDTYVYRLRRTEGMDAYLHHDPLPASADDIAAGRLRNTLLIMKAYRLEQLQRELTALGVPPERQGTVVSELGAYLILYFEGEGD